MMKYLLVLALICMGLQAATAQRLTAEEVGDVYSFGTAAKYLGVARTGIVHVLPSCDPAFLQTRGIVLRQQDRCMAVTDMSTLTAQEFENLGEISLPGSATKNIIYPIFNHFHFYHLTNPGSTVGYGTLHYIPYITIKSEALHNPAVVNPNTGQPFDGSLTIAGFGNKSMSKSMVPSSWEHINESYTRAGTEGLSREFLESYGLTELMIKDLFSKPMKIKLGMIVQTKMINNGRFNYSVRFMGN